MSNYPDLPAQQRPTGLLEQWEIRDAQGYLDAMLQATTPQWRPVQWFVPRIGEGFASSPLHRWPLHMACSLVSNLWTWLLIQQTILTGMALFSHFFGGTPLMDVPMPS